jgi:hypothetical protein
VWREARDDAQVRVLCDVGEHRNAIVEHACAAPIRVVVVAKGSDGAETILGRWLW